MSALDDLLVLVELEDAPGAEAPGEVGRERVDAVGVRRGADRLLVALVAQRRLAGARCGLDDDQPGDVRADDLPDAALDLRLGLVVAPTESDA